MATNAFDFTDFFQQIENEVAEVINSGEAADRLRERMSRYAMSNVYGTYFPTMFHRQYLLTENGNYQVTAGGMHMTVENTAMSEEVFGRIEGGSGYTWKGSDLYKMQPYPRPYSQQAIDDYVDDWLLPEIERRVFKK